MVKAGTVCKVTLPSQRGRALALAISAAGGSLTVLRIVKTKPGRNEGRFIKFAFKGVASGHAVDLDSKVSVKRSAVAASLGQLDAGVFGDVLRELALFEAARYYEYVHKPRQSAPFVAGKSRVGYAGRVYDGAEIRNLVDSSLEFWLTTGRYADRFEAAMAKYIGVKHCSLVNSGSSANLLAFMALTSPKLGARAIRKGDEVITVAAGFPTTVAPVIQYGAVPVFVDVTLPACNIDCSALEPARSARTKAVIVAHTLGNPFNVKGVLEFCRRHDLWLIEDNCDALGSRYKLDGQWARTGSFGHIATSSFYPPHHITMGEGGAVYTDSAELKRLVDSFRDWGRDCWCPSGRDNTCGCRFTKQMGRLPYGYDHKYTYTHFGFNLKATDMQAAIGCAQLEKLPGFVRARTKNWKTLRAGLAQYGDLFVLPEASEGSEPSWFGFLLIVRDGAGFTRDEIVAHLEARQIQTRMLFAGNFIKHPCFDGLAEGRDYRVSGGLSNTDLIMNSGFWIGVYPGMGAETTAYMLGAVREFLEMKRGR